MEKLMVLLISIGGFIYLVITHHRVGAMGLLAFAFAVLLFTESAP